MVSSRQRVRLGIAYDGTQFAGWAKQPGLRTVQGVLEAALQRLFQSINAEPLQLTVAGRTDAGVHATGQVAHLDLEPAHVAALLAPKRGHDGVETDVAAALHRRLAGILGADPDVAVSSVACVPAEFDARFSAVWRRYHYRIADAATVPNPLRRFDTVAVSGVLDVSAMHEAAATVLGLRDFATFCKARPDATTIRELQQFSWRRDADGVVVAELQADAFCHSMVRALVGGCVAAGSAKFEPARLGELQAAAERTSAFAVMPPHGLTLTEVGYPEPSEWGTRADAIRAKRTLDDAGGLA